MSGSKCIGCLWCDTCGDGEGCENHTPLDGSDDVAYYSAVLQNNMLEYEKLIAEYGDDK